MSKRRKAFTLVEVMIGFSILAGIAMIYLVFVRSSAKELQFSADHLNAVVLSQKVAEDLIEELALNPYGFETLGILGASDEQEVIEGRSVFFSHIEDTRPPFGKVNVNSDGAIGPKMQPLYDTVENFKFKVAGSRLANSGDHEDRNLMQGNIEFFWKTQTGRGKFNTAMQLFSPVTSKKVNLAMIVDEAAVDARIPAQVFGKPSQSIAEIAASTGENVETLQALGRVALITRDFVASSYFVRRKNEIRRLLLRLGNTPGTDLENQFEVRKKIAETWYDIAQTSFQVVAYLAPQFAVLQAQGKFTTATGTGLNAVSLQQDLFYYRIIYEYFVASLVQSRYYYNGMLKSDLIRYKGGKVQVQLLQKLTDLYRIVAIISNRSGGMQEYRFFLNRIKELSDGRYPYFYRFAAFEQGLLDNPDEWMKRYPNLANLNNIIGDRVPAILGFIKNSTIGMITK